MFRIFQRLRWVYLSVFGIQVIPMSAIIVWRESENGGHSNFFDLLIASALKIDDICYLSLITSVIIVDIGRYLVGILLEAPQDRAYERGLSQGREQGVAEGREQGVAEGREQGVAEGREQGAAEERQRWLDYDARMRDYNRRFKDARERDEPFDEPPPDPPTT